MIAEGEEARLGEAWLRGPLVLSWDDVLADAAGSRTGSNVVLHEFAHELDDEDGEANGAPALERGQSYADWARVLGAAYERLRRDAERGRESVLDDYGAESPGRVLRRGDGVLLRNARGPADRAAGALREAGRVLSAGSGDLERDERRWTIDDVTPAQGRACRAIGSPRWSIVCASMRPS